MRRLKISPQEKRKYLFLEKRDYVILNKIHQLEERSLSSQDRKLAIFLRTQLEQDWRTPLVRFLNTLLKKYK